MPALLLFAATNAWAAEPTTTPQDPSPPQNVAAAPATPASLSLRLPDGGRIWATEDPALATPLLNVSTMPIAGLDGQRLSKPLRFHFYSNYPDFAERYELRVYRGTDLDQVEPLAVIETDPALVGEIEWDGALPAQHRLKPGDALLYVLRAYGADGEVDETYPGQVQLLRPIEVEQARHRDRKARLPGMPEPGELPSASAPHAPPDNPSDEAGEAGGFGEEGTASTALRNGLQGENRLRLQNIPINGSRIRIYGQQIPARQQVRIDGQTIPVSLERKFIAEYLLPVGERRFTVEVGNDAEEGAEPIRRELQIDVTGKYFFLVGLADVTASKGRIGGSIEPVAREDGYNDDFLLEGRLAFYLKGKVKGKYLITAHTDTREGELKHLLDDYHKADPRDIFRRLDPDRYYPVYGDDSSTYRDVDTQGRLYLRVDWDKSHAVWGNFVTGIGNSSFVQYSRSLYGAAADWRSTATTALGELKRALKVFASEAETLHGHSEFIGTGGSLYYLKHTDILPGSDQVVIEVRDPTTGRVEKRISLRQGGDYEIDWLQGRILLNKPLAQFTRDGAFGVIRDLPLDGLEQFLLVDYEFRPNGGLSGDNLTGGLRGHTWLGEHVGIGATYIDENRGGDDYSLRSVDTTLQAGRGTWLKLEAAQTENTQAPIFFSDNGGLFFLRTNPPDNALHKGTAYSADGRVNFKELGWTDNEWTVGAWWRRSFDGYSVARRDFGLLPTRELGVEFSGELGENVRLSGRATEQGIDELAMRQAQLVADWQPSETDRFTAELRYLEGRFGSEFHLDQTVAALRYGHKFGTALEVYGVGQATVASDEGFPNNDRLTLGARHHFGRNSLGAEASRGHRGEAYSLNGEYWVTDDYSLYGNYTLSTDTTSQLFGNRFNTPISDGLTIGQRWRATHRLSMFTESQSIKTYDSTGTGHTYGLTYVPVDGWNVGLSLQSGELFGISGPTQRRAVTVTSSFISPDTTASAKIEYRRDNGAEQREQWVTVHQLLHKFNDAWRIAARINYSDTVDHFDSIANARFVEGNFGFAYRPWDTTRWTLLGKYTYLYDLAALGQFQETGVDQKSHILALEGIYEVTPRWSLAGKLAHRVGEIRAGTAEGPFFRNSADFAAVQMRYRVWKAWDGLAEYRWIHAKEARDTRAGWLVGLDRRLGENFSVGAGYNFTDFSDDLREVEYDHRGWFLNLVGKY